jgi:hypothetical protein
LVELVLPPIQGLQRALSSSDGRASLLACAEVSGDICGTDRRRAVCAPIRFLQIALLTQQVSSRLPKRSEVQPVQRKDDNQLLAGNHVNIPRRQLGGVMSGDACGPDSQGVSEVIAGRRQKPRTGVVLLRPRLYRTLDRRFEAVTMGGSKLNSTSNVDARRCDWQAKRPW